MNKNTYDTSSLFRPYAVTTMPRSVPIHQKGPSATAGSVPASAVLDASSAQFENLLRCYGLDGVESVASDVRVRPGERLTLFSVDDGSSAIPPIALETRDIDLYKHWLGTPDAVLAAGGEVVSDFDLPDRPWTHGEDVALDRLSEAELKNTERASWHYIFGHSPAVASYREIITRLYAPFKLSIFAARTLVVEPGGEILLPEGVPAALLFNRLEIQAGGCIRFMAPFNLTVRNFIRSEPQ